MHTRQAFGRVLRDLAKVAGHPCTAHTLLHFFKIDLRIWHVLSCVNNSTRTPGAVFYIK
jgi:hypothetical protein